MERQKNKLAIGIVLITYLVGCAGFLFPWSKPLFLWLVPFHLLLVFGLLLWCQPKWEISFFTFLGIGYVFSMGIELVGVHTQLLFGNYRYGHVLGIKWNGVPLIIGVNWLLITYGANALFYKNMSNNWLAVVLAALGMVFMDYWIEPVAIRLGFWHWQNGHIPMYNYICWFFASLLLSYLVHRCKIALNLRLGLAVLGSQLLFFIALNYLIR